MARIATLSSPRAVDSAADNDAKLLVNLALRWLYISHLPSSTSPARLPGSVRRRSALSMRRRSRCSARDVNIRYGSRQHFVIRSSTITQREPIPRIWPLNSGDSAMLSSTSWRTRALGMQLSARHARPRPVAREEGKRHRYFVAAILDHRACGARGVKVDAAPRQTWRLTGLQPAPSKP